MGVEIVVPLGAFGMVVGIVWLVSHFNAKKRREVNETIRHALTQGKDLPPNVLEQLSKASGAPRSDLQRGVVFLAVAAAMAVFAVVMQFEEGEIIFPILAASAFPAFVGLAHLGLWAAGRGNKD